MAFMRIKERQPERAAREIDRESGLFKGRLCRQRNRAKRLAGIASAGWENADSMGKFPRLRWLNPSTDVTDRVECIKSLASDPLCPCRWVGVG